MKPLLLLIGLLLTTAVSHAQEFPSPQKKEAWEQFKTKEGPNWTIRWDKNTGLPKTLVGTSETKFKAEPVIAAKAFLMQNMELFSFKSELADLQHVETKVAKNVNHVEFQQYYKGLKIEGAEYKVHIRKDGTVDMINGNYYPAIDISTSPTITSKSAVEVVLSDLKLQASEEGENTAELIIFPKDESFYLAYQVEVFYKEPFTNWEYILDAQNGTIIRAYNKTTSIYPIAENAIRKSANYEASNTFEGAFVTGVGDVYPTHPGISSVTTKNLLRLDGNGKLDGTHVRVKNSATSEAYSPSETFQYTTVDTHFDEANLYYHVDNFRHNFIEYLFGANSLFDFIEAFAHSNFTCFGGANNACFDPTTGDLYFGDGKPFAKEDKIIYHEYSHKVVWDIESGIQSTWGEEGAISEGVPDYFAGSFTGRAKILNYASPGDTRDMDSPSYINYAHYQFDNTDGTPVSPHNGAAFFSSILWDIRNNAGISVSDADDLVLGALFRLTGSPDFLDFRNAMIAEDNLYNDGAHFGVIQNTFAAKGVGSYCSYQVSILGEQNVNTPVTHLYTANPQCGDAPYQTYSWYRKLEGSGTWTSIGSGNPKSIYFPDPSTNMQLKVVVEDASSNTAGGVVNLNMFNSGGGGVFKVAPEITKPESFSLSNNYPNPFNPSTQIKFELPQTAQVSLKVYNIMGQEVATLVNSQLQAGFHSANFKADNLSSGVYIARITAMSSSGERFTQEIKMQLIK